MSKIFEEKGETYIVSDSVDSLDTESMVDKSVMQKILDRVSEAVAHGEASVADPQDKEETALEAVFTIQSDDLLSGKKVITSLSGILAGYHYKGNTVIYELVLSVKDFLKVPTCLHSKNVSIIGVMLLQENKTVINYKETKFTKIKEFITTDFSSQAVRCVIVLSS